MISILFSPLSSAIRAEENGIYFSIAENTFGFDPPLCSAPNACSLKATIVELLLNQNMAKVLVVYHHFFNEMFKVIRSVFQKNASEKKFLERKEFYTDFTPT